MSVVKYFSDDIAVMYLGQMVEKAPADVLFQNPVHPYTKALLSAIPMPDPEVKRERIILQGDVPNPADPPSGCHFHKRCPYAKKECSETVPPFVTVEPGHQVLCWLAEEQQSETKHEEK